MTTDAVPSKVLQMRLVVEADDFDDAVRFYRDVLGLAEQAAFEGTGDARVIILDAGRATLELANPAQKRMIDEVEVGRQVSPRIRVAFEVIDATRISDELVAGGADLIAPPTETPWRSLNARLDAPAGLQLTLFQELEPVDDRASSMHIELVTIIVDDYDTAIDFFVGVLGFELVEDSPSLTNDGRPKRWVVVRPPRERTAILLAQADGDRQTATVGAQVAGRVGFFLRVDDFDASYGRMIAAGVEFVTPPRDEPYGRFAVFLDVAGNRWDLLGPRT